MHDKDDDGDEEQQADELRRIVSVTWAKTAGIPSCYSAGRPSLPKRMALIATGPRTMQRGLLDQRCPSRIDLGGGNPKTPLCDCWEVTGASSHENG